MKRCPNCRARRYDGATCRRCGMDLSRLIEVEQAAERLTAQSISRLALGDSARARGDLTRALRLHRAPLAELPVGFARKLEEEQQAQAQGTVEQEYQISIALFGVFLGSLSSRH